MNSINNNETLWVEKFRPQTVADCILPERIMKGFKGIIDDGELTNLILSGGSGIGKTTIARALCVDLDMDYIIINGSEERGLDVLRSTITDFATTVSFSGKGKVVILDECLEENEEVRIGTVDNWTPVKLKDLEWGVDYPVVSFNMETKEFENDTGSLISDKEDELYEVELEDGRVITLNSKHPFIVLDENGNCVEMTIEDGLSKGVDVVVS